MEEVGFLFYAKHKNNAWNLFIGQPFAVIDINGRVPIISFQNLLKLVDANSWPTT